MISIVFYLMSAGQLSGMIALQTGYDHPIDYYEARMRAERLIDDGAGESALSVLDSLLATHPEDGGLWLLSAGALRNVNCARAIDAYEEAIRLGWLELSNGRFQQATCEAQRGRLDEAARRLQEALDAGYRFRTRIGGNRSLRPLAEHPQFGAMAGIPEDTPADRENGWRRDLAYLVSEVRRTHHRFRNEPFPPSFEAVRRDLEATIGQRTDAEMVTSLQRLLAQLGDGHTLIYPFGMEVGALLRVPISLYWFSDGLFVINANDEHDRWIGWEVTRIGNLDPNMLLEAASNLASHDNAMGLRWVSPTYLTFPGFIREMGGVADGDTLLFDLARGGERRQVSMTAGGVDPSQIDFGLVPPKTAVDPPPYLARIAENYWFEERPDGLIYVQFNRILDSSSESLRDFALRLRERLSQDDARNVVVDVRHNNGGEGSLLRELVRTLVHFDSSGKKGRLFVLSGRNTFSAAQTFIGYLDTLTDAIFIGEPSGSKPNRVGDESLFRLPYSGVLGAIASGYHQTASKDARIWITPDLPVSLSAGEYFAGRDPAMGVVEALLSGRR